MKEHKADVCIVGAGPAGLTLALLLVRSGMQVAVIERSRSFTARDYRGEILQPGAMALLAELGVYERARARGGYELSRFQLIERGRVLMDIDYAQLPKPYDFLLSIPQLHVLEELYESCRAYDTFEYLPKRSVSALVREDNRVTGVTAGVGEEQVTVQTRCVVAADGRYSKVRRLADIGFDRLDVFEHDILWLKVEMADRSSHDVRVLRANGNPVLIFDAYPGQVQIGWTLPHGGYRHLQERGFRYVKEQILKAVPEYAEAIETQVTKFGDLSLLDVFAGYARSWVDNGLVLIGDCAHTHGPVGAQGINLAIADAVLLHPVLMNALRSGDISMTALSEFARDRRPDIEKVMKLQQRQSKAMLSQGGLASAIRPTVTRLLRYTPMYRKVLWQIAFGRRIHLATEFFA
jgi:monooxygenase